MPQMKNWQQHRADEIAGVCQLLDPNRTVFVLTTVMQLTPIRGLNINSLTNYVSCLYL